MDFSFFNFTQPFQNHEIVFPSKFFYSKSMLHRVCLNSLKKIVKFFLFSDYFDVLILKIILKK